MFDSINSLRTQVVCKVYKLWVLVGESLVFGTFYIYGVSVVPAKVEVVRSWLSPRMSEKWKVSWAWKGTIINLLNIYFFFAYCSTYDFSDEEEVWVVRWVWTCLCDFEWEVNHGPCSYSTSRNLDYSIYIGALKKVLGCVLMQDRKVIA